jgi:ribonuclease HII
LIKIITLLLSFYQENIIEAGIDEAGRGCYAGPVFAAAVILPQNFYHPLLNDSKLLTETQRNLLRPIIETQSIAYAVASIDNHVIDTINILQATFKAMHKALDKLSLKPKLLLVDGNRFKPYKKIAHQCIVQGDGKYAAIAAASILAKTYRDEYMKKLHAHFPHYCWDQNKGYGTVLHRNAIEQHGLSKHHRKSFNIMPI